MVLLFIFSLHSELDNVNREIHTMERAQETDSVNLENKSMVTSPVSPPVATNNNAGRVHTRKEQRSANTLYQELSFQVSAQNKQYPPFTFKTENSLFL